MTNDFDTRRVYRVSTGADTMPLTGSASSGYHIDDNVKPTPTAATYFAYLYAKKTNEAYRQRYGRSMDLDALAALTGSANAAIEIAKPTPTTPEKKKATTMDVPKPKPMPCPKCQARAVCDEHGDDAVIELIDHAKPQASKPEDRVMIVACQDTYAENGARARIRVCASCGNVYASVLRVQEA